MTPTPHAGGKELEVSETPNVKAMDVDALWWSVLKGEYPDGRFGNEVLRRLRKLAEIEAAAGTPPDDETFADWQERMFKVDTVLTRG